MSKLKLSKIVLSFVFLLLNLCLVSFAQTGKIKFSTESEIKEGLSLVPCKNGERLDAVKKLFQKMGASDEDIKIEKFKSVENLVVTKKGKTENIIVIGAHYDKVSDGCGAIDNWSGIVILANLYRTIKDLTTDKTYIFAAFGKEEIGLVGSDAMAKAIPKEKRAAYCSMINLDSFGLAYPQVLINASDSKMTKLAKEMADELKMPFSSASLSGTADTDSTSFIKKDIPAIAFHGLSDKWQDYLHDSKDKLENVNVQSVYIGYRYILNYAAKIDSSECGIFRK
jgi:Zn-dependent M28 family amino/carboxypeptidase